jgi:hypothetical protein
VNFGVRVGILLAAVYLCSVAATAGDLAHGLWVWKSQDVLAAPAAPRALLKFCESEGINEVYVSVATDNRTFAISNQQQTARLIALLHRSNIRVEALLSSVDADQPGKHRDKLLGRVRGVVEFNRQHPKERFDAVHLDVEPHQRPENKGPGNLRFLPDLVNTYRAVAALAGKEGMAVDADIPNKYLKGEIGERRMLLSSYQGLGNRDLAKISVALRTPDYGPLLRGMFQTLDQTLAGNPHYAGWARHSYNDTL